MISDFKKHFKEVWSSRIRTLQVRKRKIGQDGRKIRRWRISVEFEGLSAMDVHPDSISSRLRDIPINQEI